MIMAYSPANGTQERPIFLTQLTLPEKGVVDQEEIINGLTYISWTLHEQRVETTRQLRRSSSLLETNHDEHGLQADTQRFGAITYWNAMLEELESFFRDPNQVLDENGALKPPWDVFLLNAYSYTDFLRETKVLDDYFGEQGQWKRILDLDRIDFNSLESVLQAFEDLVVYLTPLAKLSDTILRLQIPSVNEHDINHILRVALKALKIDQQMEQYLGPEASQFTYEDLFVLLCSILYHDLGQAITLRQKHGEVGGQLVEASMKTKDKQRQKLIDRIKDNVEGHVVKNFDIRRISEDKIYNLVFLADEMDVDENRLTENGALYLENTQQESSFSMWNFVNKHTIASYLEIRHDQPCWVFRHDIQDQVEITRYFNYLNQLIFDVKVVELATSFHSAFGTSNYGIELEYTTEPPIRRTDASLMAQIKHLARQLNFVPVSASNQSKRNKSITNFSRPKTVA